MTKLKATIRKRCELNARDVAAMYALYRAYYAQTDDRLFEQDMAGKSHVIELHGDTGLQGFSTLELLRLESDGARQMVVFSGDTIIDQASWGEQALSLAFCEFAGRVKATFSIDPLYWFLISKGYRTYRYLSLFARDYYPSYTAPTPHAMQSRLDTIARHKFRDAYDAASGLIRFQSPHGHLKPQWAGIREGLRQRPEIQFFLERNPHYNKGDELACLTKLEAGNLRSLARRAFVAGLAHPLTQLDVH
ncbi:hypothetical protein [Polaromonas sp.]|uniref:hypothetical protein n=1 Tax=Polaromonas sp. TaxID=1869339 RepID=UPI003265741F